MYRIRLDPCRNTRRLLSLYTATRTPNLRAQWLHQDLHAGTTRDPGSRYRLCNSDCRNRWSWDSIRAYSQEADEKTCPPLQDSAELETEEAIRRVKSIRQLVQMTKIYKNNVKMRGILRTLWAQSASLPGIECVDEASSAGKMNGEQDLDQTSVHQNSTASKDLIDDLRPVKAESAQQPESLEVLTTTCPPLQDSAELETEEAIRRVKSIRQLVQMTKIYKNNVKMHQRLRTLWAQSASLPRIECVDEASSAGKMNGEQDLDQTSVHRNSTASEDLMDDLRPVKAESAQQPESLEVSTTTCPPLQDSAELEIEEAIRRMKSIRELAQMTKTYKNNEIMENKMPWTPSTQSAAAASVYDGLPGIEWVDEASSAGKMDGEQDLDQTSVHQNSTASEDLIDDLRPVKAESAQQPETLEVLTTTPDHVTKIRKFGKEQKNRLLSLNPEFQDEPQAFTSSNTNLQYMTLHNVIQRWLSIPLMELRLSPVRGHLFLSQICGTQSLICFTVPLQLQLLIEDQLSDIENSCSVRYETSYSLRTKGIRNRLYVYSDSTMDLARARSSLSLLLEGAPIYGNVITRGEGSKPVSGPPFFLFHIWFATDGRSWVRNLEARHGVYVNVDVDRKFITVHGPRRFDEDVHIEIYDQLLKLARKDNSEDVWKVSEMLTRYLSDSHPYAFEFAMPG